MAYEKQFSGDLREQFAGEVLRQLRSTPPTFIVDTEDSDLSKRKDPFYMNFTQFLDDQYKCVEKFNVTLGVDHRPFEISVYKRAEKKQINGEITARARNLQHQTRY